MTVKGREELLRFAQTVIGAFLVSARQEGLAEEAKSFLSSNRCNELVDMFLGNLVHAVATEIAQERRGDPFRRLLVHPLTEILEAGGISRALLPNYFNFLHLVLGDGQNELSHQCEEIMLDVKRDPDFTWDFFYDDPRARKVLWTVLMRIAEAFKRFEARRDWFIGLMQTRQQAISLASNAFIPLHHSEEDDKAPPFGPEQFNLLFGALYRPLLTMSADLDAAFTRQFGAPPAKVVAPLVEKLV